MYKEEFEIWLLTRRAFGHLVPAEVAEEMRGMVEEIEKQESKK